MNRGDIDEVGHVTFCLGCGNPSTMSRCPACQRKHKAKYGPDHKALRKAWAPRVAVASVACCRCHKTIATGAPWDLDHLPNGTSLPAHLECNRSAGAQRVGGRR